MSDIPAPKLVCLVWVLKERLMLPCLVPVSELQVSASAHCMR